MNIRTKEYNLKIDDIRQIKLQDITAPIRVSGTAVVTYEVLNGVDSVGAVVPDPVSGVIIAPDGAWGSELRIECTGAGTLTVTYMG